MLAKKLSMSLIIVVVSLFVGQSALACENSTHPITYTYTEDAHFDEGVLVGVNHDEPNNNQLQLDISETTYSFVNVPATGHGTIVRIDADSENGDIIGEYRTAPQGFSASPSRTSVDSAGNVWAANQGQSGPLGGSVVKIGIVIGGTREVADGSPNDFGEYVTSYDPDHTTCVDRDGDGRIRTSAGLGNILIWPEEGVGGDDGIVERAVDECILLYQRLPNADNPQHVSVDANDDVWVGGYSGFPGFYGEPGMFYKLDGQNASILTGLFDSFDALTRFDCGGFGGLIDDNGILWSASQFQNKLLYYDPTDGSGGCIDIPSSYGLAESVDLETDRTDVFIWNSSKMLNQITKIDAHPFDIVEGFPKSTAEVEDPGAPEDRGVAITSDGDVWVAKAGLNVVRRLDSDGNILSSIPVGTDPTGLAVDANGKIWVANRGSSNVMRIDPTAGDDGFGAVDLTVGLGVGAAPDAYSDMISNVTISTGISPPGTWTVIHDSGAPATVWDTISWNDEPEGSMPPGTAITVEARVADTEDELAAQDDLENQGYLGVENGMPFDLPPGQLIQIRATLTSESKGTSPVLSDLTVQSVEPGPEGLVCDINDDEVIDIIDILGIFFTIGDSAGEPFDPRDWDDSGTITIIDARGCVLECTNAYCAPEKKLH